jgi:hypothetical protein
VGKIDALVERFFVEVVARWSGRSALIATLIAYPGVGLVMPVLLGFSTSSLVGANIFGVCIAAFFCIGWLAAQVQASNRRHLVEWTTDLRLLTAEEFEWLVGELFRREGWVVEETGRQGGPDGGIDLRLTKGNERRTVQCKRWTSWQVGVADVRAFAGALVADGPAGSGGIFVTLSDFTTAAQEAARRLNLTLLDNHDLYGRIESVRRTEPCPTCTKPMVLDRSRHGWWFRCVAPGCGGKRDLGNEPGRAVELLSRVS